jgi:hypothetical protein
VPVAKTIEGSSGKAYRMEVTSFLDDRANQTCESQRQSMTAAERSKAVHERLRRRRERSLRRRISS